MATPHRDVPEHAVLLLHRLHNIVGPGVATDVTAEKGAARARRRRGRRRDRYAAPHLGETVTAVFVPGDDGAEGDELAAHAKRLLAPYKVPRRFEFVDAIPRNAYGKIDKRRLRERFGSAST
ncbi:AMP-binding enzyme [Streptomyces graminofaciens]|uniref:AMP-binding enzyme n=1 Tax=Streptomyces graminofaciens TaxID=68212 RepID=UPI0025725E9C|nr:hypothetical protein [Streptomyces graminofaciens]